jgi:hypothetical protein
MNHTGVYGTGSRRQARTSAESAVAARTLSAEAEAEALPVVLGVFWSVCVPGCGCVLLTQCTIPGSARAAAPAPRTRRPDRGAGNADGRRAGADGDRERERPGCGSDVGKDVARFRDERGQAPTRA